MLERLGALPQGKLLERVKNSPHYIHGAFRNRERPSPQLRMKHPIKITYDFLTKKRNVLPHQPIPTGDTVLKQVKGTEVPAFLWLGHSTYFIFWKDLTILLDPILSLNASPIYKTNVAFEGTFKYNIQDVPEVDLLILTHDHFDHLDYFTITHLHQRCKHIICPLGMESHLIFWGVDKSKIHSLDWDESYQLNEDVKITSVTTRHNSGRTMSRNQTLWSAYTLKLGEYNLFLAGDGGYGKHFKDIGNQYGPFDFGTIENGQYNMSWPKNHMFPHQSIQATLDLKLKKVVPIHWGKFALAMHTWNDSIKKYVAIAEEKGIDYCVPMIGELYYIDQPSLRHVWWNFD